jgi:oxaloacetate decarboxylase alpha subunit
MNIKEIKELVKMLDGTDISELTFESEGNKIVIKKGIGGIPYLNPQLNPMAQFPISNVPVSVPNFTPSSIPSGTTSPDNKSEGLGPNQVLIVAPMVGTFYRAPAPDVDPYVQIGQMVEVGQVVCIIEAMKLMNEIESEFRGRVVEVLVENAHPVEYGQPLFVIEKV